MKNRRATTREAPETISAQCYGVESPQPSASAAHADGAIGPGAVAASKLPQKGSELAPGDIESLRSLVKVAGGVDALIRWLQLHPELGGDTPADLS